MTNNGKSGFHFTTVLAGLVILSGLYLTSLYSYVLFHSIAEIFSIVIAFGIFVIAWNSRKFINNNYLLFLGIAYLFVGGVDLIHTLAYKGMGVFTGYNANLPTQLWIAARYMQGFSLLAAPLFLGRRLDHRLVFAGYSAVVLSLFTAIFYIEIFPDCYIEGVGLTTFKKTSEYIICLVLLLSAVALFRKRDEFEKDVFQLLLFSIIATVFSELAFTFYISVYGLSNLSGHFLKLGAFYFIYRAIIETGLMRPYDLIFRDLNRTVALLEAANIELEAFSYSVSHDLRAPLRAISGFSGILAKDYSGKLDAEGMRLLDMVRGNALRMGQLIDDLLALSRVGRKDIEKQEVDMERLAGETLQELNERSPGVNISALLRAKADPALIRQVFINLLSNAVKFTGPVKNPVIEVGSRREGNENIYFVRDNGVGFDMTYACKLFQPFNRLHGVDEFEGTGIGLAIVSRIIGRHGGRVWAEGKVDGGATFYFTLPVL